MMGIFVDRSYRTLLGVGFYDRVSELDELGKLLQMFRTVVVYGPRNVGKSELVKYWLRREGVHAAVIDARFYRDRSLLEEFGIKFIGIDVLDEFRGLVREIVKKLVDDGDRWGLASLVTFLAERILEISRALRRPLYVFIDEYHLLPRYRTTSRFSKFETALDDLEALAAVLAKDPRYEDVRLILTVGEGFVATSLARRKLLGYSTSWLLVEPMDLEHFAKLYNEYRELRGCSIELEEVLGLVGALPGYLDELCRLDREALMSRVRTWLEDLEIALSQARQAIASKHELSPRETIRRTLSLLRNGIKPLEDPVGLALGEALTNHNVVYPKHSEKILIYRPQLTIYETALELATEKRLSSILDLDPHEVYRETLKHTTKT